MRLDSLRGRERAGDLGASAALAEHLAFIRATLSADDALRIDAEESSTPR